MAKKKEAPTISEDKELKRLDDVQYLETGNVGLDLVLSDGKGIPLGANIMLYGPPGTGKTTLFGDIIKRILDKYKAAGIPMRMHYIDSESSRELLKSTGAFDYVYDKEEFAPQQLIYHEHVNSFQYLENVYNRINDSKDIWSQNVHFIFIDSVTKLLSQSQLENEVDKADFGDNARARKKLYGKWLSTLQSYGITQFWISQISTKQNAGSYEDPKKPAVSDFDLHNMDVVLRLQPIKDVKRTDVTKIVYDTVLGKQEDITKYILEMDPGKKPFTKNRYGQNHPVEVMLWRGHGIINAYILRRILEARKLVDKPNAQTYSIGAELAEYLGPEALEQAGITNLDKCARKDVNRLCSLNNVTIINFLKERGLYSWRTSEVEVEDDGLF